MRFMSAGSIFSSLMLCFLAAAHAGAAQRLQFDLPPQPLLESLRAVGAQSGTNVLASSPRIAGLKAPALRGQMTLDEAFERLLAGSGLRHEFIDEKTVTFVPVAAKKAAADSFSAMRIAQSDLQEPSAGQKKAEEGGEPDEVIVKGVKDTGVVNQGVIPRQPNEALRYDVIDRAAIARSGATSVSELFRSLSSNATMGTNSQQALSQQMAVGEGVLAINDTVNLRGLGAGQTLVMINGRRLFGGEDSGADLSRIPVEAIERIELLPTSGSAIYGANAVGGVVNIILRKDYEGSELTAYYGTAEGGVATERRLTFRNGMRFNDGRTNISLIAEAESKDPLLMKDRRYYQEALARIRPDSPYYIREIGRNMIGPVATVATGSGFLPPTLPLNIPADPSAAYAAVPQGSTGVGLTPASFNGTARIANVSSQRMDRATLLRGLDGYSMFATLEHSMREGRMGAYAELSWRYADTSTDSVIGVLAGFRTTAANPLNPFRNGVTPGFAGRTISVFFDPSDLPHDRATSHQQTLRAVGGLKGHFNLGPQRTYNWAIDISWDRNDTYARNLSYARNLAPAITAGFYNPFRDLRQATPISGAALENYAWANVQRTNPEIGATNWRLNGDLFRAWGGPARFSLGLEARFEYEHFTSEDTAGAYGSLPGALFPSQYSERKSDRRATAGYLEVVVPLVGEKNRVPMMRELELLGAVRMEHYDDFGSAAPPMMAIKYKPFRDLTLRASYSEGFQPPTQTALFQPLQTGVITAGVGLFDPLRGSDPLDSGTYTFGGNPDLKPETSDTWDAGVIYSPSFAPGLVLAANYFRYDKFDVVGAASLQDLIDFVPGRITRGAALPGDPAGTPGPIIAIDASNINLARQFVDGWDLRIDYTHAAGGSRVVGFAADATMTDRYQQQAIATSPLIDRVGENGFITGGQGVLHWRGKASVWIESGNMTWTWNSRFFDSYVTDTTTPTADTPDRTGVDGAKIPSTLEHDLVFNYAMPGNWGGVFSNTRWTAGVLNVFDRQPPPVSTRISMWYSGFNDPRQRVLYLQMRRTF